MLPRVRLRSLSIDGYFWITGHRRRYVRIACPSSFVAEIMQKYLKILGVPQPMTSAHHAHTNSVAERYNQSLRAILTKLWHGAVRRWDEVLPETLFATRVRVHQVIRSTPFELPYGVKPRLPLSIHKPSVFLGPDENRRYRVRERRHVAGCQ